MYTYAFAYYLMKNNQSEIFEVSVRGHRGLVVMPLGCGAGGLGLNPANGWGFFTSVFSPVI